ncbi:Zinc finger C2H2 type [Paragonimus skrjabini miyazakii]|uniref:Zinc finger C2H2 type n=1 Tax=Paragonimus skrjabini miyazakii TaxID=59628 RepID=A0A8S9YSD9_9TREM|nr:Zinc finger C2H2 type [Paragonimus skrjabini miyazakii]
MSQPLKESPRYNLAEVVQTNHTSPYGRLYSILKSGLTNLPSQFNTPEEGGECTTSKLLKRKMVESFLEPEHGMWCCWQCKHVASSESELAAHIRICSQRNSDCIGLPGCPFCPRDAFQASDWPFPVGTFNVHVAREHPDVSHLICGYCLEVTDSPVLEDLIHHILSVHKLPWRPSPASLAHLRCDQLPHRVVTCLGCGWCTFVLRASNAAQPPTSLESHLNHCSFSGGRVHLTLLTHEMCASKLIQQQLLEESVRASQSFTQVFPLVRGYPKEVTVNQPKEINLHYRPNGPSPLKSTKMMDSPGTTLSPTATGKKPTPKKPRGRMTKNLIPKPINVVTPTAKRVTFDVPVTLPPAQPAVAKNAYKKSAPVCLYVCPLCGDNALASLRERDEHLQSAHNGELVFPCQICGLAYPLYIALRRHAALKHNADYDMVRYGPAELLDSEPIECPECHLVAFTDRAVVKLHLVQVHKLEPDQAKSLLRSSLRKSQPGTTVGRGGSTGRRGGRGGKREVNTPAKDRTMFARSEKHDPKTPSLSRLERLLGAETGDPAPASCHLCRTTVDNAKEFRLHMELVSLCAIFPSTLPSAS